MARKLTSSRRRKLQPALRRVANGGTEVNALRAEHASAVAVSRSVAERVQLGRPGRADANAARPLRATGRSRRTADDPDVRVSAFVRLRADVTDEKQIRQSIPGVTARNANQVTADLSDQAAVALEEDPGVAFVELGQPLTAPQPVVSTERPRAPGVGLRRFGSSRVHGFGREVLVGVIDVGGFDFSHPDFLDEGGRTRFERIWDQGGEAREPPGERGTSEFRYGSELRKEDLDRALEHARGGGLAATELEPQSQMGPESHATHVASILAGNRGVCRGARIAGVLISIPDDESERRLSFYDSTRIAHAVDYLTALARECS